jgi:HEAT repeat protein
MKIGGSEKRLPKPLGRIGDPQAVDRLIEALEDEHYGVRWRAAQALGKIGDPRTSEPLTNLASKDKTEAIRKTAAEALEKLGSS